jgi:hypothetical protein
MPRAKKPSVPKFEPVFIADYRPAVRSLGIPEAERASIFNEDFSRIIVERTSAFIKRREVLRKHLEVELGVKLGGRGVVGGGCQQICPGLRSRSR